MGKEEEFRRLLIRRLLPDINLGNQPDNELHHLHREYNAQSYLVSYWQRPVGARRYIIVAWHDIGRIVKDTLPELFGEAPAAVSRLNVVDEQGRIIYGPPLRSGEFTVGVKFPTTLYNWHLQVSPAGGEEIARSVQSRKTLELVFVTLSLVVIVTGVLTILLAVERERRLNALKTDFVANVSHELKTPLALVRMFAELLQSGRVANEDKRKEYLDIIVNESERLSNLIENVLDFARVERGRSAYEFAVVSGEDVARMVQRAVQVLRYRAEREHVKLETDIAEGLPSCRVDERALQLAIINLVDNAIKYGCAGVDEGSNVVNVKVTERDGSLSIAVIDEGPGIASSEKERIFERFVRGSAARDGRDGTPVRGSGIGLALVKHIAESHGRGGARRQQSGRTSWQHVHPPHPKPRLTELRHTISFG